MLSGEIQKRYCLFPCDSRKSGQEVFYRVTGFQMIHQRLHGHTGAGKTGSAMQYIGIDRDYLPEVRLLLLGHASKICELIGRRNNSICGRREQSQRGVVIIREELSNNEQKFAHHQGRFSEIG